MEMDSVEPNANDSVTHSDAHSNGVETVHSEANKKSRAGEGELLQSYIRIRVRLSL